MNFDFKTYVKEIDFKSYESKINDAKEKLLKDDMSDWKNVDLCITKEEIDKIKLVTKNIRTKCDVFLVIGIGGSFLGAQMIIKALNNYFNNEKPEIIFVGTTLSTNYLMDLTNYLKDKDVCVNVISKSGSTMETKITFDYVINEIMSKKYDDFSDRIFVTTDPEKSILKTLAEEKGYQTFTVPKYIGGRYSVLSAVGLLPVSVAGYNIDDLLKGAYDASQNTDKAIEYAIIRDYLYHNNKIIESYTFYEEKYLDFGEWLKQLYAETQGKNHKAILPISTLNTRDLHSLGQFFQEGPQILFETIINVKENKVINTCLDKELSLVNDIAVKSVMQAHYENDINSLYIELDKMNEYNLGYLIYFFEYAAGIGGYLLDVYPFDQPGVSKYKTIINQNLNEN